MIATAVDRDVAEARRWARYYHRMGWQVLPSRTDRKAPALKAWAHLRTERVPEWFARKAWTRNLQIITGRKHGLIAVDVDGDQGRAWWEGRSAENGGCPATWSVLSPSGGRHVWFRVPRQGPAIPHGDLFLGEGRHQGVEIKGDGSQIVAPPSRYDGGPAYRFLRGPRDMPEGPALAPDWLVALPVIRRRGGRTPLAMPGRLPDSDVGTPRLEYSPRDVLDRLDAPSYAKSWGLRLVTDTPNPAGWCRARSIFRGDDNPSASFRPDNGVYCEHKDGLVLRFFDLAAALNGGRWPTWVDAVNAIGREVGAPPRRNFAATT